VKRDLRLAKTASQKEYEVRGGGLTFCGTLSHKIFRLVVPRERLLYCRSPLTKRMPRPNLQAISVRLRNTGNFAKVKSRTPTSGQLHVAKSGCRS
jgi:hypothetical protein